MAIMYNQLHVDEQYADKLEANLYYGSVLVPGVTCDDSYTVGPAGGIYVHKLSTGSVEPGKPGRDFQDEAIADDLIPILLNNNFQKSKKLYGVQAAAVDANLKDATLAAAQAEVKEGWQSSGVAALVDQATACADTTVPTVENAKDLVIDARKEIVSDKGTADVVLCSPSFYALILKGAGKDFLPTTNDKIAASGNVGVFLGMTWIEANTMVQKAVKYYDHTGTLKTVDMSGVDFVIYNHETLSTVTNYDMARLIDSEMFSGSKAQVEQNSGYRVRNNKLARVHKGVAA